MEQTALHSISAVDGRYWSQTEKLSHYFSEYALIKYRLHIEVEYFIALCELPLPQLKEVNPTIFNSLRDIINNFNDTDAAAIKAIEKISSPEGMGMSPSRITVSTAGVSKMIKKLADDKVKFNLAVSLHAANDIKRNEIMPINETNNLKVLIESLNYFYKATKSPITFEYILFANFNDSIEDADDLIEDLANALK